MKKLMIGMILGAAFAVQADTLALYPFTEGKSGEKVSGKTILNSVDAACCPGTFVTVGEGTDDALVYDDEVPARYLFQGLPPTSGSYSSYQPVCTSWRSIKSVESGATSARSGGQIDFAGLATLLSSNETFTIEFFYKMPTTEAGVEHKVPMMQFDMHSDLWYNDECKATDKAMTFFLTLTETHPANSGKIRFAAPRLSTSWGYTNTYRTFLYYLFSPGNLADLADGNWHHVAIVCKGAGVYEMFCDYYSTSSTTGSGTGSLKEGIYSAVHEPQTVSRALELFRGVFIGKIAGLRVTDEALTRDSFLRAFDNRPTDAVFHWRLEGTHGEKPATMLTNVAPSYASSITNQFCRISNSDLSFTKYTGNGTLAETSETLYPIYTNVVVKSRINDGVGNVFDNLSSLALYPQSGSENCNFQLRAGMMKSSANKSYFIDGNSFTFEAYARFDYTEWNKRVNGPVTNDNYLTILGYKGEYGGIFGRIYYIVSGASGKFAGINLTYSLQSGEKSWTVPIASPEKWHHFAWVYDKENKQAKVYIDGVDPKSYTSGGVTTESIDLSSSLPKGATNPYFFAGGTYNGQGVHIAPTFDGMIDEVRLTNRVLEPSEFIQKAKIGTVMTVR